MNKLSKKLPRKMVLAIPEIMELPKGYLTGSAGETPIIGVAPAVRNAMATGKDCIRFLLCHKGWKFDYLNLILGDHFITRFHDNNKRGVKYHAFIW